MRFNCGLTEEEKFQLYLKKTADRNRYLSNWHKKFAWWPIQVSSGDCRWLEYVERKGVYQYNYGHGVSMWHWSYRPYEEPEYRFR